MSENKKMPWQRRSSSLAIRIEPWRRTKWRKVAKTSGARSMAQWMIDIIERECGTFEHSRQQ